jgi:hypothetical protein
VISEGPRDVLKFYEDFRSHSGWEHLEAMRTFLPRVFRERDLSGCTFVTSHETLCITRYRTYPQWLDKPSLFLNCTAKDRLKIEFQTTLATSPVVRLLTESVNCPPELALQEFDRLYARFLAANDVAPS